MLIRPAATSDVATIAAIHAATFPRQGESELFIGCQLAGFPLVRAFVAEIGGEAAGYAIWAEKSGFRRSAVVELVQIAVATTQRGRGIGAEMIRASLDQVTAAIVARGDLVAAIMVTTAEDSAAQALYRRVLGAEVVAAIPGLFARPEVVMVAKPSR